jgi:DNA-binding XRE family transcriptional regulator
MKKSDAIAIFGTRQRDLALAVGVTRSAISQWGQDLTPRQTDMVLGAALRLGKLPAAPQPDKAA